MSSDKRIELETMALVGELAMHIAHDLNNYFQVIMGNARLLMMRTPQCPDVYRKAEAIWKVADHSANVFRDLLNISRSGVLEQECLQVGRVIKELQDILGNLAGGKNVALTLDLRDSAPVKAHKAQIEHIVLNLAMNARHAIRPPGRISIATEDLVVDTHQFARPGRYVLTAVSDTGVGLPPGFAEGLTKGLQTGASGNGDIKKAHPTGLRPLGGNGLGLYLVRHAVAELGGFMQVASTPGGGSTFGVYLPVH
jgi:two-component system cell cycle sensor histidine kinase/response regulator CckA